MAIPWDRIFLYLIIGSGNVAGLGVLTLEQGVDLKLFRNVARYMSSIRADIRDVENSDLSARGKKAESDELYREMIRTAHDALGTVGK